VSPLHVMVMSPWKIPLHFKRKANNRNGLNLADNPSAERQIIRGKFHHNRFEEMPESLDFEHYQLLTNADGSLMELGRGAMGVTYKAFDTNLYCHVALKVISSTLLGSETAADRFLREARAAARLRHRNVASVFHLGKHGDSYFYSMEFIDGETVLHRVKRDGPFSCPFALEIAQQVACALIAADEQQLVHRDIKPSNVMLVRESDGEILAKVIDFGLVKSEVGESSAAGELTLRGFVGTPYFASPEQLDRQPEDIRSDIYSLGVTLWYMLTGKPTFMGSMASVIAQHLEKSPPFESLAILPAQVVAVLRRMLEKERSRRIQTPSELRKELRRCIDSLTAEQPKELQLTAPAENCETIELSNANLQSVRPESGALLKNRYRLIEDINPANPGHTFHAEDLVSAARVTIRIFMASPELLGEIDHRAMLLRNATHPNFIHVLAVEHEKNFRFVVFEWLEGFPLVDLLRARRALTLRELLFLLKQIASAVDAARRWGVKLEMNLRDILIHFPDSFIDLAASNLLLRCPLDEWPAFVVKMSLLGEIKELEAASEGFEGRTMISGVRAQQDVVQLGILVYELLGGKPGGFTPLANVSEEGNEILRKCLTPGRSFSTATEFYNVLAGVSLAKMPPPPSVSKLPEPNQASQTQSVRASTESSTPEAVSSSGRALPRVKPKNGTLIAAVVLGGVLAIGGVLWFYLFEIANPVSDANPELPKPKPALKSTFRPPPPQPGKAWTNSLEMRFVPLGGIHISVWQTRVRDFEAFVEATGYDAVGGMSSAITQNGFKLNRMSWKDPGFPQTPNHAVVGVSWEDANQFCAWLTKKERNEGTLKSFQLYRLPTDREWSEAVGLEHEQGATPSDRSARIKGVYPWGSSFPPPVDTLNYAGSESRVDAPETWTVIPDYHDAYPRTAPVSAFNPNALGLCALGGNVWEWCMDKFETALNWRTLRGGSWATSRQEEMLSSYRRGYGPLFRSDEIGFRCVIASNGGQE
jgi:serine/threonine protein kinase/formylglycine-generating enzyme required for sulfatase activity